MNRWIRWTLPVLLLGVAIVLGAWWRSGASTMFREPLARLSPDRVRCQRGARGCRSRGNVDRSCGRSPEERIMGNIIGRSVCPQSGRGLTGSGFFRMSRLHCTWHAVVVNKTHG